MNISTKMKPYKAALATLPGTNGVGRAGSQSNPKFKVNTVSPEAAKLVDTLIEDKIEGMPVDIAVVGTISAQSAGGAQAEVAEPSQDQVLDVLASLPGATGAGFTEGHGFTVTTVDSEATNFLNNLVEDEIQGSQVRYLVTGEFGFG